MSIFQTPNVPEEYENKFNPLVIAEDLMIRGHAEQVDKAGKPYYQHPLRVCLDVLTLEQCTPEMAIAALLHDVFEDTSISENEVYSALSRTRIWYSEFIEALRLLNRDYPDGKKKSTLEYYGAISKNQIALAVKLADMRDNL